ncbi:hypothetical protein JG687_00012292 [Phytophthora cactorum]|uniref:Cullin family profile domain-containing protein n=1 Tax=Phytophthora cactorum TaxID=29920 RepID=A0A8T1U7J0_9STRA|nr:hypothetical protein JG687_00012292 [Phytophthora cactorum]
MSLLKASTVNFENEWREMQPPLASLVTGTPQTLTNEKWLKMYSGIYKICTNPGAPQAEMLFFRLRGLLVKHVEAILKELNTIDGEPEFLNHYCTSFEAFTTGTSYISELFRYLVDAESFLINNQKDDLHRMFSLFSELSNENALISFKNILKKYIERSGMEVVQKFQQEETTKNPEGYIEALVQVRNKYFELIKDAFGFHPLMRTALDQQKIESISVVFCLIDDKDIFKKYYSKFLAKRLIKGTFASNDMEILLIQKLRDICGCDFVSKLQKMMKDKMLSKELMDSFTAWLEVKDIELRSEDAANAFAIDLHHAVTYQCDVLTAGAWPISSAAAEHKIFLPPAMEAHTNLFTQFYTGRSTGRKLLWIHHLSFGMIQSHCFDKRYEFLLSFYQMLILVQFNTAKEMNRSDIVQLTNIPEQDCAHHLATLVKAKILTSDGSVANPTYAINFGFSSRKLRISAVPNSPVESPKVAKAPTREVEEDRKMSLQAAIVRVLKTRRDIRQAQLMHEVAEMLVNQFVPTTTAIKQNVEILIQKEYLRRHEDDQTRFLYVA